MVLDMRTIVLITMIFNLIFGIGMFVGDKYRKAFRGVSLIGGGFLMTAFGFQLMFLRDIIPAFYSVVICNTAILIGVVMTFRGLFLFYQKKAYYRIIDVIGLTIFFGLFCYFLLIEKSVNMRVIIICFYLLFYYCLSLYAVLYKPVYNKMPANWFMGSILILEIIFYLFRVSYTVTESQILNFMDAGIVHSVAIIMFAMWSVVICFGVFIVMADVTNERLEQNAYFDSLTSLHNRRALSDETFRSRIIRKQPFYISAYMLCDIDNFKTINDQYGHLFGDYILQEIASTIQSVTRRDDFTCRYGGDEFFVYLEIDKPEMITQIGEKLRIAVESKLFTYADVSVRITLSIGVFLTYNKDVNCTSCISCADEALYRSKEKGRNRVEIIRDQDIN